MMLPTLMLLGAAQAQDLWLATDRVAVGVNSDGSFVDDAGELGILWDPDGPEGELPVGGDLLVAGWAVELWSLQWSGGDLVEAAPQFGSDLVLDWDDPWDGPDVGRLVGHGSTDPLDVEVTIDLPWGRPVIWAMLTITATEDVADLWAARVFDPDPDAWSTASYLTDNSSGDGWAVGEGTFDQRALALATPGGVGGVCHWCTLPSEVVAAAGAGSSDDLQPGVAVQVGGLAAGDTVELSFAYGLALGATEAVDLAVEAAASDDHDGDGAGAEDCDDTDAAVAPGLTEVADGRDNDCDGTVDEDTSISDDDGDGLSEADGDCDDADPLVGADCGDTGWPEPLPEDVDARHSEQAKGCAVVPAGGGLLLALVALARRRRR